LATATGPPDAVQLQPYESERPVRLEHRTDDGAGDGVSVRGCQRRPHFVITDTKKAATNNHTMAHTTHPNANPKTTAGKMTKDRATIRNAATGCLRFQSGTPASSRSDAQVTA